MTDTLIAKHAALLYATLSAFITLFLGFGVLNILWLYSPASPLLPGLYAYKAASYGDGLFLPLFVGSATFIIIQFPQRPQLKRSIIIGMTSALLGIAIQAHWVISDNTKLNWTIPEPHKFNFAGWYHAFFFTLMFFIASFLMKT